MYEIKRSLELRTKWEFNLRIFLGSEKLAAFLFAMAMRLNSITDENWQIHKPQTYAGKKAQFKTYNSKEVSILDKLKRI